MHVAMLITTYVPTYLQASNTNTPGCSRELAVSCPSTQASTAELNLKIAPWRGGETGKHLPPEDADDSSPGHPNGDSWPPTGQTLGPQRKAQSDQPPRVSREGPASLVPPDAVELETSLPKIATRCDDRAFPSHSPSRPSSPISRGPIDGKQPCKAASARSSNRV